jgi:hypothetical protein
MEPVTFTASATVSSTAQAIPTVGFDIFSIIFGLFGNSEGTASFFSADGFFGILDTIWSVYAILAYIFSIFLLTLYAYASMRRNQYYISGTESLREEERIYDMQFRGIQYNSRLSDILAHSESENPNDWKLAIIEADIILDDILKKGGYAGNSLGERLRSISSSQLQSLDDAWEAHKIRNRIAHDGADFVLTKRLAEDTINRYRRVFTEFGVH